MRNFYFLTITMGLSFSAISQNAQSLIKVHNVDNIAQMNAIANPNTGNLIYVTENSTMYQHNGTSWLAIVSSGSGWLTTGNAGTSSYSDFIGTTDNQAITFRVNNINKWAMAVNGRLESQNSNGNVAVGNISTFDNNTTGFFNVAIGNNALQTNTTGNNNIGIGRSPLQHNSTGSNNIAIGREAMRDNTTGHDNVAIGYNALNIVTNAEFNIAIGSQNLRYNTTGDDNVAIGNNVLRDNTTGQENIGIGQNTLMSHTTGFANTAIGVGSMIDLTTGQGNTAVGFDAFQTGSNFFFSNAFGGGTIISASQQTRIGFASASIGGPQAWSNTSDARFKENVKQNVKGLDFILGLEPVTYNMNFKKIRKHQLGKVDSILSEERYQRLYEVRQIGFLAQDVEALADSLDFDFHGVDKPENPEGVYGIRYAEFVPSLVKAIQEQQKTIEELVRKMEELQE
ncbi:tail fiber domain-containing protein [Flavobacteriales bacterium]|nr:tail fiber domain-containing protein [Flavobacteriales bacterium]